MTRVLITGISGLVGSHLAEYLLAETNWRVFGLMRWNEPLDNLSGIVKEINRGGRVELVEGDLIDAPSLFKVMQHVAPNYIFHLAAQSYVQASLTSPVWTLETNVIGLANLMEAVLLSAPEALIHNCSSSEVYGRVPAKLIPINEDCPLAPASPYAVSKAAADLLGQYYVSSKKLKIMTTRMFTHTGSRRGDVFVESSFAKQIAMIEAGLLDPPVRVGNLDSIRTILDVRDAVRAYHMLLTVNPRPGEVYNIGGNTTLSVGELLDMLFGIAGKTYEVVSDISRIRTVDVDNQVPDFNKFMEHTNWKPEIPLRKTLSDLLDYWRDRVHHSVVLQR